MNTLKQELDELRKKKVFGSKYKGILTKSEMVEEIMMMIYKIMASNDWSIERVCESLKIKDIYELTDFDDEKLEGILVGLNLSFTAGGKHVPF